MFIVAPKSELNGGVTLTVEDAKQTRKIIEEKNRLRPNAQNALDLACIYYTLGEGRKAIHAANVVVEALSKLNGNCPAHIKATAVFNRGMFLRGFGDFQAAARDIKQARELDPNSDYIAMATAEELLREGNWAEGAKLHNRARGTREGAALACGLPSSCEFWDGKVSPAHLFVINEGGAGDRINYTRYLPLLTARGINWSFFCYDELKPFYDRLPWIGPSRTIGEHDKKEFDPPPSHWTTVFSLPAVFPDTIPPFPAPFTPPPGDFRINSEDGKPLVGLAWNANELFQGGLKIRSLTEGQAMRLVCMTADKVHWINLQHGHKMPFPVENIEFETWEDTATLLNAVDGLATVDCGTLWMNLAMDKPTAVMLSACEDWKFSANWGEKLSMYHNGPSERLFDVEKAIDGLISDIRNGKWPKNS